MDLNVKEMLTGDVNRLRFERRYNRAFTLHDESVAEHGYYVCLYANFIARWVVTNEATDDIIDLGTLFTKCVIHDLEEGQTGDVDRYFKHADPELSRLMKAVGKEMLTETLVTLTGSGYHVGQIIRDWSDAKDFSGEGMIVQLAEYMSCISFAYHELSLRGNRSFCVHLRLLAEYRAHFDDERFEFLQPIISQVNEMVQEILDKENQ